MRPWHIRTQQEILDRIHDAIKRGDQGDEFNEYMRCAKFVPLVLRSVYQDTSAEDWAVPERPEEVSCDDARAINATAKVMLPIFERALRRTATGPRVRTIVRQYRAWKWLLGHEDADNFFSAGLGPVRTYKVLLYQMTCGVWEQMTNNERNRECFNRARSYNGTS